MKQIREITISPSDEFCIWNVDLSNIAYDCVLNVGAGCQALYIKNGTVAARPYQTRGLINEKKEKREGNKLEVIGVNYDKPINVLFGAGGIQYRDKEDREGNETVIGICGECMVRINDAWLLYTKFGNKNVTPSEVNDYVRETCGSILGDKLAAVAQKTSYMQLRSQYEILKQTVKPVIADALFAIGLALEGNLALGELCIPDDYIEKRAKAVDGNRDRLKKEEELREKERERQDDLEALRIISKMGGAGGSAPAKAFCPECGMAVTDQKFCPRCGKKI